MVWDHEGRLLYSGARDNQIKVWDTLRGICIRTISGPQAHTGNVSNLHLLNNSQVLLSSSSDGTMKLWQLVCLLLSSLCFTSFPRFLKHPLVCLLCVAFSAQVQEVLPQFDEKDDTIDSILKADVVSVKAVDKKDKYVSSFFGTLPFAGSHTCFPCVSG